MGMILLAFGLVLVVEGLAYALAPSLVETLLEGVKSLSYGQRRAFGLAALALGVAVIWAARAMGAF